MKYNLSIFFYKLLLRVKKKMYLNSILKWSNNNLDTPKFIISFDFETQRDLHIIETLTKKLNKANIRPFYAIPGELIEKNQKVLKYLGKKIVFINHGYKIHTKYCKENMKNYSSFSYVNELDEVIFEDITKADFVIKKILKQKSKIFRTPHFGEFCEKKNMNFIYKFISNLGYKISLSTTPIYSLIYQPIKIFQRITEIPCNAYIDNPRQIIDSWSIMHSQNIEISELIAELNRYYNIMNNNNLILNVYFDPSDVINIDDFFTTISKFSKYQMKDIDF